MFISHFPPNSLSSISFTLPTFLPLCFSLSSLPHSIPFSLCFFLALSFLVSASLSRSLSLCFCIIVSSSVSLTFFLSLLFFFSVSLHLDFVILLYTSSLYYLYITTIFRHFSLCFYVLHSLSCSLLHYVPFLLFDSLLPLLSFLILIYGLHNLIRPPHQDHQTKQNATALPSFSRFFYLIKSLDSPLPSNTKLLRNRPE